MFYGGCYVLGATLVLSGKATAPELCTLLISTRAVYTHRDYHKPSNKQYRVRQEPDLCRSCGCLPCPAVRKVRTDARSIRFGVLHREQEVDSPFTSMLEDIITVLALPRHRRVHTRGPLSSYSARASSQSSGKQESSPEKWKPGSKKRRCGEEGTK